MREMLWHAMRPLRVWWRRTWFYRRFLKGPLSDRILFHPYDALPRSSRYTATTDSAANGTCTMLIGTNQISPSCW